MSRPKKGGPYPRKVIGSPRFETTSRYDAERAAQHRTRVRFQGGEWRAVCSCAAWSGPARETSTEAERDGDQHRGVR